MLEPGSDEVRYRVVDANALARSPQSAAESFTATPPDPKVLNKEQTTFVEGETSPQTVESKATVLDPVRTLEPQHYVVGKKPAPAEKVVADPSAPSGLAREALQPAEQTITTTEKVIPAKIDREQSLRELQAALATFFEREYKQGQGGLIFFQNLNLAELLSKYIQSDPLIFQELAGLEFTKQKGNKIITFEFPTQVRFNGRYETKVMRGQVALRRTTDLAPNNFHVTVAVFNGKSYDGESLEKDIQVG